MLLSSTATQGLAARIAQGTLTNSTESCQALNLSGAVALSAAHSLIQ